MVRVMTFTGRIQGLRAASLHAQYFEEYLMLSRHVERVTVVTDTVIELGPDLPENLRVLKVPALRVPKVYGATKLTLYSLAPLIRRDEVDVLYVRTFSPPELNAVWVTKVFGRRPTVLTIGGTWLFGKPDSPMTFKRWFFRRVLRNAVLFADVVILYSWHMFDEVRLIVPELRRERVRIVHNAVNVNRFRPGLDPPQRLEEAFSRHRTVLFVGRLTLDKGVGDLIEAYALLRRRHPDLLLLIAGTGDPRVERHFRELARRLGVSDGVLFLGGVPNEEVPRLMANCTVFAYPSRGGEGIPRAMLEAMACGRPVVATSVSGIPEAVVDGHNGFLVRPRDVRQLADRLERLLVSEELASELGRNARDLVVREFSYDVVIPKLAELMRGLAG